VDDELLRQELEKHDLQVSDEEVEHELLDYKSRTPGGTENFDKFLARAGKSIDGIKEDIRARLLLKKLLAKSGGLEVSDQEIQDYYTSNQKRFDVEEKVQARHILIKVDKDASRAEVRKAKKRIDVIYREAKKKGTDFAELAREKSEGPSAPLGGDLGSFGRGRMVESFETVAFAQAPGTVSKPFRTGFGWHIMKVEDHTYAHRVPLELASEDIEPKLAARKFREARAEFLADLHANGTVEIVEKIEIPTSDEHENQAPKLRPRENSDDQ
jgi:parvulin-like peptidyl-prolyl isomerase